MKIRRLCSTLALVASTSLLPAQSLIIDNAFDSNGGWTNIANQTEGWWPGPGGSGGLTPAVGNSFFTTYSNNTRPRWVKGFTSTDFTAEGQTLFGGANNYKILAGTYELTVYVGMRDGNYYFSGASNYEAYLTAGGTGIDRSIAPVSSVKSPVPTAGQWERWTFTYVIDEGTRTQGGHSVVGQSLGGQIALRGEWAGSGAPQGYIATDGFALSYSPSIPEKASTAAIAGGLNLPSVKLTHGPWVTNPDIGAVTIGFTTDLNTGAGVEYRVKGSGDKWSSAWHTEAGQLVSSRNNHSIRLTGLNPENQYEYRPVLFVPPPRQEGDKKFREHPPLRLPRLIRIEDDAFTFRPFSHEETYSFFVVSDLQFPTERRHQILQNYHDQGMSDSRFVVLLGDLTNSIENIETDILHGIVDKTTALGGTSRPHLFIRGNHEWRGLQADLWTSYFAMPGGSTYAAFRCGDAFYLILDTGEDKPPHPFTAHYTAANIAEREFMESQKAWLASVVESQEFKTAKFRIVLAHSAPYSHSDRHMGRVINNLVEDFLTSDAPENRIHLWISGHTHFYARTIPGTTQAYALSQPFKKFYRDDRYRFPVVTLDGPTFIRPEGDVPTSGLKVAVEEERLFLESIHEDGTVFDRFEVLPDGSINNLNEGLEVRVFTFEPL